MNERETKFFSEGFHYPLSKEYRRVYDELILYSRALQESIVETKDGKEFWVKACGCLFLNNYNVIIFPKGYRLSKIKLDDGINPADKTVAMSKMLFQCLHRYREEQYKKRGGVDGWKPAVLFQGEDEIQESPGMSNQLFILYDYQENGYIRRRNTRISQRHAGRTLWQMTIHRTMPMINHRQVIYHCPYMQSNIPVRTDLVQRIHMYVLSRIYKNIGWLLNHPLNIPTDVEEPCSQEYALYFLQQELHSTFIQREINLKKHIIQYLQHQMGIEKSKRHFDFLLTTNYQMIWEKMCGVALDNRFDALKRDLICIPTLDPDSQFQDIEQEHDEGNHSSKPWRGQRPDILCLRDNRLYIFDAKYYDYKVSLPGWGDLEKQFFYYYTIKERLANISSATGIDWQSIANYRKVTPCYNALLLPWVDDKMDQNDTLVRRMGRIKLEWNPSVNFIDVYLLNEVKIQNAYLDENKRKKVREEFFTAINQNL